jgi:malic enzyme
VRTLDTIFGWAMIVLGVVHSAATVTMRPANLGTVWFFGAGTAVMMAGLLNVIRVRRNSGFERGSSILANFLIVAMLAGVTIFLYRQLTHNPQVLAAWGVTLIELAFSLRGGR